MSLVAALAVGAPALASPDVPRPVLNVNLADPAVVVAGGTFVAFGTGDLTPRAWSQREGAGWRRTGRALTRLPRWASSGAVWAVDVQRVRGRWLLYFAAPVDGIVEAGRCIGVATSATLRGRFRPVDDRPLVCPAYADTPRAEDPLQPRDRSLPRAGVIDPSVFVDGDGTAYLLYKTDRIPSSIRLVPLSQDGRHVRTGAVSQELLRYDGVIENPVLVRRPEGYVLLLSEGDYTRCGYRTLYRLSGSLLDWTQASGGVLMSKRLTGLCGPGGADVVDVPGAEQQRIFFHGWTCSRQPLPCEGTLKWDHHQRRYHGIRALYAARLAWADGVPRIAGWISGPGQGPGTRRSGR